MFRVGTGVRPEEAFGGDWSDVDLAAGVFTVRRAFAKGRLKPYPKTDGSRRRVPLGAKVLDAFGQLPRRDGILFPAPEGGRQHRQRPHARVGARAEGRWHRAPSHLRMCATRLRRGASWQR
jgi:integrase